MSIGLSGDELNKAMKKVFDFLNTLDLRSYVEERRGITIKMLMDELQMKYKYKDEYSESLFDLISEDEFVEYLKEKYNIKIFEVQPAPYYVVG